METSEKINIRGAIRELTVDGEPLKLPRSDYAPSVVRSTAVSLRTDTGRTFNVAVSNAQIVVTRLS